VAAKADWAILQNRRDVNGQPDFVFELVRISQTAKGERISPSQRERDIEHRLDTTELFAEELLNRAARGDLISFDGVVGKSARALELGIERVLIAKYDAPKDVQAHLSTSGFLIDVGRRYEAKMTVTVPGGNRLEQRFDVIDDGVGSYGYLRPAWFHDGLFRLGGGGNTLNGERFPLDVAR
jgi:hypothetical protein